MRLYWMLGLLCVGCATVPRPPEGVDGRPPQETVYLVPLDEAMTATRLIFQEMRYGVFEREGGLELYTSAWEPGNQPAGSRSWERYYVKGERMGPRQAVVRVFRLRYEEAVNVGASAPPKEIGKWEEGIYAKSDFTRQKKTEFQVDPFEGAPSLEGFEFVKGYRDLEIERRLLARLEMVPALEVVGGAAPAPVRSILVDEDASAAEQKTPPAACGEALAGAEPLLTPKLTLLLADPLGTRELPTAALQLLCDASAKGTPVALGLSIPASEQFLLDEYLASEGRSQDLQAMLMLSNFWRRDYQDGRSSRSMLWLIEQARRLRASGRAVSLVAIDSNGASGNAREEEMAKNVLAFRQKNADAWMLVLAGDVHVRPGRVDWDGNFEPLGARLTKALPSVRALDVGFARGSQFACRYNVYETVECNVFARSPTEESRQVAGVANGIQLFPEPGDSGFHGRLYVGALTASPPAMQRGASQVSAAPHAEK